jgi:integrative and conjugative element protein (TIGR02256 family)
MGYWSDSGTEVVVSTMISAGPAARQTEEAFTPDHAFQESEIARVYEESGRTQTYLGDWHSHPDGTVSLSLSDRRTLTRILDAREARLDRALMAILAGGPRWELAVWALARSGRIRRRRDLRSVVVLDL